MKKIEKQVVPVMPGEFSPVLVNVIGTRNEDSTPHLCGHSWVSFNPGPPKSIIFSTYTKSTLNNILRTGEFSVNMGTGATHDFVENVCDSDGDMHNNKLSYDYTWGEKIKVPILDVSPFVIECKVLQTHSLGDYNIFFAEIVCQHLAKNLTVGLQQGVDNNCAWQTGDAYYEWLLNLNVKELDPLMWLGHWYKIGDVI